MVPLRMVIRHFGALYGQSGAQGGNQLRGSVYCPSHAFCVNGQPSIPSGGITYRQWRCRSMMREILGWSASAILVVTIVRQVYRQWQQGSSKGVSKWLFIGQMAASTGFLLYSWLIKDPVFIFTNALMMISAVAGLRIVLWHRRKNQDDR